FGNRLTKTDASGTISYTYDANDRLLSEAGPTSIATYTYDDNGNTLSKTEGVNTTLYSYDFENRLVGVNAAAGATAYGYDSDGIRVAKSTGAVITRYLVDKNRDYAQVLEETENSSLTVSYVYGDDLISQNIGSSYYYLYDGQMSTRQLVDNSEAVLNEYTYDAFGIILGQAGVVANNYMYTGEQYDPNAGFYYLRARYYDQKVGRFVTTDPFEGLDADPVSLHKYLYAANNPVMFVDLSGMAFSSPFIGAQVHTIIEQQYEMEHSNNVVFTGHKRSGYGRYNKLLRPDILDVTERSFMEIKPVSLYGFVTGEIQMAAYLINYPYFLPDIAWEPPSPIEINGIPIYCFNAGGLIWYTDSAVLSAEGLALYTISDVKRAWQGVKNMKSVVSPLVRARGFASWGVKTSASVERAKLNTIQSQIALTSMLLF
ncbi:MAG: RHS repeat-associated core domain-containing protein, partial [Pseudomonadota bacterium]